MTPQSRQCLAEVIVGLVVCFAAAEIVLAPARRELRDAQSAVAGIIPASTASDAPSSDDVARLVRANAVAIEEIQVRSAASRDEAALFAEVLSIADRHRLRLEQFQPVAGAAPAPDAAHVRAKDAVASYSISLSGGFPGVVRFLDDLRGSRVFVSTRTVRVAPAGSAADGVVRAEIAADFFAIAMDAHLPSPPENLP